MAAVCTGLGCRLVSRLPARSLPSCRPHGGAVAPRTFPTGARSLFTSPPTVSVIGAPIALGQPKGGVDQGPAVIRQAGLSEVVMKEEWGIRDVGDVGFVRPSGQDINHPNARHSAVVGKANDELHLAVREEARRGNFCLSLGGDHSIAIGSVAGVLQERPNSGVIWVDAHADINTHKTSESGNIHGMSVSFLMDYHDSSVVPGFEWLRDLVHLKPEQIVYVGLRDVDPLERKAIAELGIKAFTMNHIDKFGIGKVMEMALDHLEPFKESLHLSVDIDSVDPFLAPNTGTAVRGGLTYREAHYVCEAVADTGRLGSMDMVEVNPLVVDERGAFDNWRLKALNAIGIIDSEIHRSLQSKLLKNQADETVNMALGMISSALGKSIL